MESFQVTSVKEALKLPQDAKMTMAVQVLQVESVQSYTNAQDTKQSYFPCLVGDSSDCAWLRVYQVPKITQFSTGTSLLLRGVLRKSGAQPFWCPGSTKVCPWMDVIVPDNVKAAAQQLPKEMKTATRPLNEAIAGTSPSTVTGKITQVSPLKRFHDNTLSSKFLRLVDDAQQPPVKVALFGREAEQAYSPGDVIRITDTYPYKKTNSLSTKKSAKVEFLPQEHIPIDVTTIPSTDDADFKADETTVEAITVIAAQSAYSYQACDKPICRNKKILDDGTCPTCHNKPSTEAHYSSALLNIARENNNFNEIRIFQDNLLKLFPDIPTNDSAAMMTHMKSAVPVSAKGRFTRTGLEILSTKRKQCS
ncbi:uncharacterized protein LOC128240853 [Mya arenaria]|uniref:uncharacterized protein LOC128240853 n=1 Tax=Mya arenaria TaxID=6604 RepID=UPI0022E94A48|nr:uncharacterized protein LOC128240853 [Mya arenaria]XP_052813757.1 uncharacterized protein LOC128240853 [Mya arenaria]